MKFWGFACFGQLHHRHAGKGLRSRIEGEECGFRGGHAVLDIRPAIAFRKHDAIVLDHCDLHAWDALPAHRFLYQSPGLLIRRKV
jgi:hypothetical protein